jgi:hypothetical protein
MKNAHPKLLVLACAVMEQEIRRFQNGRVDFKFLDYGLHRTPESMSKVLQIEIDQVHEGEYDGIVLGYGLCSNGTAGVCAHKFSVIIPRIHDCISLFLGSPESYQEQSKQHPGTYYLTPGWIEKGETPISKFNFYAQSYGEETARWVLHEEMKNYTRILLINTGVYEIEPYQKIARQNAEFLGIAYQELKGSPIFFKTLVEGPWRKDFLVMEKGHSIRQDMFLDL